MEIPQIKTDPEVAKVFDSYPEQAREGLLNLRRLIIETATEMQIDKLKESLKWNEPSYLTRNGSTVRIAWKAKTPDQYAMYFKCTSRLVETFKEKFGNTFFYEGTRAIVFKLNATIPETEIKQCIKAALNYHRVKHLPMLGM